MKSGADGFINIAHELGAFTFLNHPAKWNDQPEHVLEDDNLSACRGIEVYNGARVHKEPIASDLWDACLSCGLNMVALAGSDCHVYDFTTPSRPTNGWNVLWVRELSEKAAFEALEAGRFYASSGLEVDDVSVAENRIAVRIDRAKTIRFIGREGRVLREVEDTEAEYKPRGDEGYVRVEAESHTPPIPGAKIPAMAWLQPVWIEA